MRRLYYLSPTIESAEQVSDDMHAHGVTDWHFHVLSKDEAGLYSHHIHSANAFQRTDLIRFTERGLICGVGLAAIFLLPLNYIQEFTFNTWLSLSAFCILFSTWCAGIGGISQENYKIQRFHDDIEAGNYLIMVDVPKADEEMIKRVMSIRHPEAKLEGQSSTFTNPFSGPLKPALAAH